MGWRREGEEARQSRRALRDNPYPLGSRAFTAWARGWRSTPLTDPSTEGYDRARKEPDYDETVL
jgi:hypothetical protein